MNRLLMALPVWLASAVPALAQDLTGERRGHRWEATATAGIQSVSLATPADRSGGLGGVRVAYVLPDWAPRLGDLAVYFSAQTNSLVGARSEQDLAFFAGDLGIQVARPLGAFSLVPRIGAGIHAAETLAGDQLTNYSGTGYSAGLAVRRSLASAVALELDLTRSAGRFHKEQVQDLTNFTDHRGDADVAYTAWRLGLGVVFGAPR